MVVSEEYNGVKLGTLRNESCGLEADVWIVNDTTLQLTNLKKKGRSDYSLQFFMATKQAKKATDLYKIIRSSAEEYLKPVLAFFVKLIH
uniref:Uncharacterized protein n=1 Tax=Setaria digitata TaxID=48799 RepID=A0A915PYY4_9BILA